LIVVPLVLLAVPLSRMILDAVDQAVRGPPSSMVRQLIDAAAGPGASARDGGVFSGRGLHGSLERVFALGRSLAPAAAPFVSRTFAALSTVIIQLFILCLSAYYFSLQGAQILERIAQGSPLAPGHFHRLATAFIDVARAMLVGELLTALAQGVVAGVIYAVLDVQHALFFALLTAFVALVPTLGAALAWVPLCGVLLAAGRTRDAIVLAACGVFIISLVDNVLWPYFARMGAEKMHPLLLFLGIFGGLETIGAWGLILGPLVLALLLAVFRLYSDEAQARREAAARVPTASGGGPDS
jgi:predicted PurR-regulated permease PerM